MKTWVDISYTLVYWKTALKKKGKYNNCSISDGKRTEWSSVWFVIIQVINRSRQPRCGSPNSLIMGTITDQNVRHKVLLPINHNFKQNL